jgi:hypothetical protein
MVIQRFAIAFCSATLLIGSTSLFAQDPEGGGGYTPPMNDAPGIEMRERPGAPRITVATGRKLNDDQKREIEAILKIVDDPKAAKPTADDLSLTWAREDLLKALGNKQYVPFTVTIDPSKMQGKDVTVFWRVINKNPPPPPPAGARRDESAPPAPLYAYEDFGSISLQNKNAPYHISRSFTVGPGSYDVQVLVKEVTPRRQPRNAPPVKVSMITKTVEVPDLWNGELNTSSVFVADRIDPLPAPLTPQQQVERPYAMGAMEVIPVLGSKFTKKAELSTLVMIYNAKTDAANKPDVTVEYNFYTTQAGAEKFFNKTNPQALNAQTLPPQFDFAAGHQLQTGQAVPLASFPEGDYRLEIKIIDKLAAKTVVRNLNFSVVGG